MQLMPIMILSLGTLLVLAMVIFALAGPSAGRAGNRRLASLRERHAASATAAVDAQLRRITAGRATRMDLAAGRLLPNVEQLKKRLAMTGKGWSVGQYGMASAVLVVVVALLLWLKGLPLLLGLLFGLFVGAGFPHWWVGRTIKKRVGKFTGKFPDAIELLVRGFALRPADQRNDDGWWATSCRGRSARSSAPCPDKHEDRPRPWTPRFRKPRIGSVRPSSSSSCISIAIQRETGGNLSETLANLATVLRSRHQMKLKIRAMSSESKASAYIVGSLPFIVFVMIWFVNSGYLMHFFTDQRLMVAGIGGMVWMGIGAFILAKMVSFEI